MKKRRVVAVIGALSLSVALALRPHAAEGPIALDNVALSLGATTYRIPHLEVHGASLSTAELEQLFASADAQSIDERLSRFSAARMTMPTLSTESKYGGEVERTTYRDVTLENVVAGRIGLSRAAGAEETVESRDSGVARFRWGAMTSKGVDLRQLAHMAINPRVDANEALKPVVDEEIVESLAIESSKENIDARIGRIALRGAKGRAFAQPLPKLFERLDKFDPTKPESDAALARDALDALGSMNVELIDVRDIAVAGKDALTARPYALKVGRLAVTKFSGAALGDLLVDDFVLTASDGGVAKARHVALRDFDGRPLLDSNGRFPRLAHVEADGVDGDLPDPRTSETSRVKFSLAAASADFANYVEGSPTKLSSRVDHFVIDLAARGETPYTAQFLALGYRELDLSGAAEAEWREKTQEFVMEPLVFEGKDMGAATLAVTLANVTSAVFSPVNVVSQAAALAITLKRFEATLIGGELIDRILALEARNQGVSMSRARADYATSAAAALAELAGGGEKARKLGDAVAQFISKPKRLHLRFLAPGGVGALETMTKKPGEILDGVEAEATAEK